MVKEETDQMNISDLSEKPMESAKVERYSNGRIKKGSALNPSGGDRNKARALRMLGDLQPMAILRLGQLVKSENEPVALGAIKEVLDRTQGKAKQAVTVDVTSTHVLHLQALEELARRSRDAGLIDVTPVKGDDGSEGE